MRVLAVATVTTLFFLAAPGSSAASSSLSRTNGNKPNILFLMSDSMDGRVLDPTSPVSQRMELPHLRRLAAQGTNFINTYVAAPQCVPSRTTMFAGRHTHNIQAWSNSQALAAAPGDGTLDTACVDAYDEGQCRQWGKQQEEAGFKGTFMDSLASAGCTACLYGKVDVGAAVIEASGQENATVPGYHGGPILSITGRSADIRKPTKPDPINITNDLDDHVHPEDWKKTTECMEWFENHDAEATLRNADESWMMYCSVNIPHPKFATNATWLQYVNEDKIDVPQWLDKEAFHPADAYMSQSKDVWRDFRDEEILEVRKTYYAMCAETDYLLGRVLDKANATGHLKNTYVIYVSDHGEMNMEHRQVWKNSMYEASSRVPMIVAGPGVPAGRLVTNLTSLLDVFPTMDAISAVIRRDPALCSPLRPDGQARRTQSRPGKICKACAGTPEATWAQ